jgi:hypothetical protein
LCSNCNWGSTTCKTCTSNKKVLDVCEKAEAKVTSLAANLKQAVLDAVDAKVAAEGGINNTILQSTLQQLKNEILGKLESIQVTKDHF